TFTRCFIHFLNPPFLLYVPTIVTNWRRLVIINGNPTVFRQCIISKNDRRIYSFTLLMNEWYSRVILKFAIHFHPSAIADVIAATVLFFFFFVFFIILFIHHYLLNIYNHIIIFILY